MIEPAQNLSLAAKTRQDEFGIHVRSHHFDRDLLLKLPVGSLGKIHSAHSATADLLQQTIWSQSGINRRRLIEHRGHFRFDCCADCGFAGVVSAEKSFDLHAYFGIAPAQAIQESRELRW